jgi:transcriptional regulator
VDARFAPHSDADIARLVAEHPLAYVVSRDFQATPLPLIAETDAAGAIVSLFGHLARRNPQVAALQGDPDALILFQGPQGYISPRLVSNPTWAPTWNYAVVRFEVRIAFVPDETDAAVRRLAGHLEGTRSNPWQVEELSKRYGQLLQRIIAFRAQVRSVHATFKLGQDEDRVTFAEIVAALGNAPLAHWMSEQERSVGPR